MRLKQAILAIVIILFLVNAAWGADKFVIDPVHTNIGFSVRHMVINSVKGKFTDFSGAIIYDATDITKSSVSVTIKTAGIDTGNERRDNDLRSPNYLDVAKYPEISFQSSRIEKRGDGYVAIGTLTMHGVSKEIALPFTIGGTIKDPGGHMRMGVEAGLTLDRRDYGMTIGKTLDSGGLVVGYEVKIELTVEAVKS